MPGLTRPCTDVPTAESWQAGVVLICSGQAYVGAFLKLSAVSPQGIEGVLQSEAGSRDPATAEATEMDIQTVGTFCQVHHISEMESGNAQMLLLGHRRLRRLHTVSDSFTTVELMEVTAATTFATWHSSSKRVQYRRIVCLDTSPSIMS